MFKKNFFFVLTYLCGEAGTLSLSSSHGWPNFQLSLGNNSWQLIARSVLSTVVYGCLKL